MGVTFVWLGVELGRTRKVKFGARQGIRTPDPLGVNEML